MFAFFLPLVFKLWTKYPFFNHWFFSSIYQNTHLSTIGFFSSLDWIPVIQPLTFFFEAWKFPQIYHWFFFVFSLSGSMEKLPMEHWHTVLLAFNNTVVKVSNSHRYCQKKRYWKRYWKSRYRPFFRYWIDTQSVDTDKFFDTESIHKESILTKLSILKRYTTKRYLVFLFWH